MDCSKCIFNIMDDGPSMSGGQVGCKAGRLQKFIDKGRAIREFGSTSYELTQFCNMYREEDCDIKEQRYNIMPLFGIVVSLKPEDTLEEVDELCRHLESLKYPKEKLKIIISAPSGLKYADSLLHNEGNARDNETFKKLLKATYFVKMSVKDRFSLEVFETVDNLINEEMKHVCFIENNSVYIVLKSVIQQIYYNYESYENAVEGLKTISVEQDKYEKI